MRDAQSVENQFRDHFRRIFKNWSALITAVKFLVFVLLAQDSDSKKCEKKEVTGPPLQTASVSVRALIEEKIIQKRTNPGQSSQSLATQHPSHPSNPLKNIYIIV